MEDSRAPTLSRKFEDVGVTQASLDLDFPPELLESTYSLRQLCPVQNLHHSRPLTFTSFCYHYSIFCSLLIAFPLPAGSQPKGKVPHEYLGEIKIKGEERSAYGDSVCRTVMDQHTDVLVWTEKAWAELARQAAAP